jgi:hypothetical protein
MLLEAIKALLPKLPIVADPIGCLPEAVGPEGAQVLASLLPFFDKAGSFKICNMLGNSLLRNLKWGCEIAD